MWRHRKRCCGEPALSAIFDGGPQPISASNCGLGFSTRTAAKGLSIVTTQPPPRSPERQPEAQRPARYSIIPRDACKSEKIRHLLEYWDAVRGARPMPRRQEIDPVRISPLLKYVFMAEWHAAPQRLFYRIGGMEIAAAVGKEIGGKWLEELYADPRDIDRTLDVYRAVVRSREPLIGHTEGSRLRLGRDSYDWVVCPLSDDGSEVSHFIGLEDYVAAHPYFGGLAD
jgi:hypothetical protein